MGMNGYGEVAALIKQNVESLLDAEMVQAMKKRPGMFIGSQNYKGIIQLFGYIIKAVLRSRSEPLSIEWMIKEDENFSLHITGNKLDSLKEKLNHFIHIESLEGFDRYPYYMFYLFMERIAILLVCEGEQICVKKNIIHFYTIVNVVTKMINALWTLSRTEQYLKIPHFLMTR